MGAKVRESFKRWLHDNMGLHVPLEGTKHVSWLGLLDYATCKYCGMEIMSGSDFGYWILVPGQEGSE